MISTHLPRAALAALVVVLASGPSAQAAPGPHTCRDGDPPLQASATTSCRFAARIFTAYDRQLHDSWRGPVRSPVTGRWYAITCWITAESDYPGWYYVRCEGPRGIAVRFPTEVTT
jgi:hypothetical protein